MIRKRMSVALAGALASLVMSSAAFSQTAKETVKQTIRDMQSGMYDLFDTNSVAVSFDKSSSSIESNKDKISALVKAQDSSVKDLKLVVAAWSDEEFPMRSKRNLSSKSIDLANKRLDAIATYLKTSYKFNDIEKLNMAKHENRLSKWWGTDESAVKDAVKTGNSKKTWVEYEADTIRRKGGPGKAVVLLYNPANLQ